MEKPMSATAIVEKPKTWQQTKSENTRINILNAAIDCFYRLGYANTTTENVAGAAGVSRGAMLHHFPTRFELIRAAVEHLHNRRLAAYESAENQVQAGALYSRVEDGIDAYWEQLNSPDSVVFLELKVAARTDEELAKVLKPVIESMSAAWIETSKRVFPDLALSEAFSRANLLTGFMMDGMAMSHAVAGAKVPVQMMLSWLKRELRRSFQDVLGRVERPVKQR